MAEELGRQGAALARVLRRRDPRAKSIDASGSDATIAHMFSGTIGTPGRRTDRQGSIGEVSIVRRRSMPGGLHASHKSASQEISSGDLANGDGVPPHGAADSSVRAPSRAGHT